MDNQSWWLYDHGDGSNSDSDVEDQTELENRLYSIVHHNDLSQPLPPELAKHYSVCCDGNGEVVVTLNNSLEEIKLEESKNIGNLLENIGSNKTDSDITLTNASSIGNSIISESNLSKNQHIQTKKKRFRYSDINLDDSNIIQESEEIQDSHPQNINYFQLSPNFFSVKRHKRFAKIVLPPYFYNEAPHWKTNANSNFLSIESTKNSKVASILKKMTYALQKVNPGVKKKFLHNFAQTLYLRKIHAIQKKDSKTRAMKRRSVNESNTSNDLLDNNFKNSEIHNNPINRNKIMSKLKSTIGLSGSISLNISPFKPDPEVVDLVSDDERNSPTKRKSLLVSASSKVDLTHEYGQNTSTPRRSQELAHSYIPDKWSKSMIKFYTKNSNQKSLDLSAVFMEMQRTTTAKDWKLDPRDQVGSYNRTTPQGKHAARRCPNCYERGHLLRDCPKPPKIPACSLCGEAYHTDYSCPNKICMKCGVYLPRNVHSGECETCYYSSLECEVPCDICGKVTHRSALCPDLWRSFHATTSGEKKIPTDANQNTRKYCCNCARKGHFSHDCPFVTYTGQQISSFVTNYSAQPLEKGTAEIVISEQHSDFLNNRDIDSFLQNLANSTFTKIELDQREINFVFRISGTFEQCKKVKSEIEGYVNTKKRKRSSPFHKKKKQRLRY